MNSIIFEEFVCAVCLEIFNEEKYCPKLLTCGHSFCSSCLEKVLVQSRRCPTCKACIEYTNVELIPVNYIIRSNVSKWYDISLPMVTDNKEKVDKFLEDEELNLVKDSVIGTSTKEKVKSSQLKSEGYCGEHKNRRQFRCMDCERYICGTCVVLEHAQCRALLIEEAFEEMKGLVLNKVMTEYEWQNNQFKQAGKFMKAWEIKRNNLYVEIKKLPVEHERRTEMLKTFRKFREDYFILKSERKKFTKLLLTYKDSLRSVVCNSELVKVSSGLEKALKTFENKCHFTISNYCQNQPPIEEIYKMAQIESVYAVRHHEVRREYCKVTVKDKRIWIQSFKTGRPTGDLFICFKQLFLTFIGPLKPQTGFLQGIQHCLFGKDLGFANEKVLSSLIDLTLDKPLVFIIIPREKGISIAVYDMSTEKNVIVNVGLLRKLEDNFPESCFPSLMLEDNEKEEEDQIALVQILHKIEPQNLLVSIVERSELGPGLLSNDDGIIDLSVDCTPNSTELGIIAISSGMRSETPNLQGENFHKLKLSDPVLPPINKFFDTCISFVSSPSYFVVQDLKNLHLLESLMRKMNDYYSVGSNFKHVGKIYEGGFYAYLNRNKIWYRVHINHVVGEQISGNLVDYGHFFSCSSEYIQPLWPIFRKLPQSCFRASLAGVVPINDDWSPDDCLRFRSLVGGKNLLSLVVSINCLNQFKCLDLRLIETSDDYEDIYVHDILIREKRAVLGNPHETKKSK